MATRHDAKHRHRKGRRLRRPRLVVRTGRRLWHEPLEDRRLLAVVTLTPVEDDPATTGSTTATEQSSEQTTAYDPAGETSSSTEGSTSSGQESSSTTGQASGSTDNTAGTNTSTDTSNDSNTDTSSNTSTETGTETGSGSTDSGGGGTVLGPIRLHLLHQVTAAAGTAVSVPLLVTDNASGLFTADIVIGYDTSLLSTSVEQISPGTLLPSAGIVPVVNQQTGEITISVFSSQPAPTGAEGSLVNIEFDVSDIAEAGTVTPVDLRSVDVNDGLGVLAIQPRPGRDATDGVVIIEAYQPPVAGRFDVTLTATPAEADAGTGETYILPNSLQWVDEWASFYVQIWASGLDGVGLAGGAFELWYNTDVFTAIDVEFGPAFVGQNDTIDDAEGMVEVEAIAAVMNVGVGRPALLAEVYFLATDEDPGAPVGPDRDLTLAAHDLGLDIKNATISFVGRKSDEPAIGPMPETTVIPVVYDVTNDGKVSMADLAYFAVDFLKHSANPMSDYDASGYVNFADLSWFALNFGRQRAETLNPAYPDTLIDYWLDDSAPAATDSSANSEGLLAQADHNSAETTAGVSEAQPEVNLEGGSATEAPQEQVASNATGETAAETAVPPDAAVANATVLQEGEPTAVEATVEDTTASNGAGSGAALDDIAFVEVLPAAEEEPVDLLDETGELDELVALTGLDENAFDTALTEFE